MAEGRNQFFGSIFGPFWPPNWRSNQGVGLQRPKRDLAHADPEWYQRDLDQPIDDPDDADPPDPLPTPRHRKALP